MRKLGRSFAARDIPKARDAGTVPLFAPHAIFPAAETAEKAPICESWDDGRLLVNRLFARLFRDHRLTSCTRLFDFDGGVVVRRVGTRETRRFTLDGPKGPVTFYLKRHGAPAWRDRIMPWLHGARPILGARNEWEAILRFIAAEIPTMTPVAFGECDTRSLLITHALPADCNLLEFVGGRVGCTQASLHGDSAAQTAGFGNGLPDSVHSLRELISRVAEIAQRMHCAGLHHQDFYLNHLLLCDNDRELDVRVIDLGRVRLQKPLALRWIIKDLAQLNFSAERLSYRDRIRFLRLYLKRRFIAADRDTIRRIALKSRRIACHTMKHDL